VIISDPRKNALLRSGNQNDKVDARKLSDLPRAGLAFPVYHGEQDCRTLKELCRRALDRAVLENLVAGSAAASALPGTP
jgi:hypothetical protein